MIKNYSSLLRINHWIKNIIIFIPLIFLNRVSLWNLIAAFFAFCFAASAVYIINDISDINTDKSHPVKKLRPIASGEISIKQAYLWVIFLMVISLLLSFKLSLLNLGIIILYLINNVLYTKFLKEIALIDLTSITFGFILRLFFGYCAVKSFPALILVLLVIAVSYFFEFSKRLMELNMNLKAPREAISPYSKKALEKIVISFCVISFGLYLALALKTNTKFYFSAIPFIILGLYFIKVLFEERTCDDPCITIYRDKKIIALLFLYIITLSIH